MWLLNNKKQEVEVRGCENCKCLIEPGEEHTVDCYFAGLCHSYHYCYKCKPKYKKRICHTFDVKLDRFYGEVEMTEDGVPVGYEPVKRTQTKN